MRAEEALAKRGNRRGDARDGQAGGVGGEERVRREVRQDAREQRSFDFEIFGDGFDDPIALGELGQIVVEVAGSDQRGERGLEECGGLGFGERVESGFAGELPLRAFHALEGDQAGASEFRRWPDARRCASPWFRRRDAARRTSSGFGH